MIRIRTGVMWLLGLVSVMRRAAALCARYNGLMVASRWPAVACEYSVAIVESTEHECRDQTLGDFTSRATNLTQSPQLKEATADKTTNVLLHRLLIRVKWLVRSADHNLRRLARLPNHCSSVLSAFSWSRRDEHQSGISVT